MKTRTEKLLRSEDTSELKLLKRNKVKGFKAKSDVSQYQHGPRKKKHKIASEAPEERVIKVLPVPPEQGRDPIIRVYSEDSAYVDTTMMTENNRISFRMESQDTELTELRLSSFYSQDEILNQTRKRDVNTDLDTDLDRSKTMMTMSSLASTEFDPQFKSEDCLVRSNHTVPDKSSSRHSVCCYNFVLEFIRALLISDYAANKVEVTSRMQSVDTPPSTCTATTRLITNFRGEGRVTTGCLWHACRAVTIGLALIITGISLTVIGYLSDQRDYREHLEMSRKLDNYTSSKFKDGRLHLSNISFSGPVVLGTGGFLVLVACVMTLEARDNAAKIVPATACLETSRSAERPPGGEGLRGLRESSRFRSSASQTAIRDKDIVAVLTGSSHSQASSQRERRFSSGSVQLPDVSGSASAGLGGDNTDRARQDRTKAFVNGDCSQTVSKCPSAPCIPSQHCRAEVCTVQYRDETSRDNTDRWARPQFRLLTPTMYRSRMASTRQTHSMDCSSSNDNLRAAGIQPEDSLELELGASASRVDNKTGDCSGSDLATDSLQLDLHLEGSVPVTLLVRDESRSTRSTVKQVSWGSTSSLAGAGETDCPPGGKISLAVPPTGILRTSSPHSSSSQQILKTSSSSPHSSSTHPSTSPQETEHRPSYSLRSDTVLEICLESEDISFIDDEEVEEVSEEAEEVQEVQEASPEPQQIVIKLNNESEPLLTSIVVSSRAAPVEDSQRENFDEISETSFQLGYDVTIRAPMSYEESTSDSSNETVGRMVEQPERSLSSRRKPLVRQRRLDSDLHPDMTRKRHSLAASQSPYRHCQESRKETRRINSK